MSLSRFPRLSDIDGPHRFVVVNGPIEADKDPLCLKMQKYGELQVCPLGKIRGFGVQLHVLVNSNGGRVSTRDRVMEVIREVQARGGFSFAYVRRSAASAAASIAFTTDSVHTLPDSNFMWHAAIPQARLGKIPKHYTVSPEDRDYNRAEVDNLISQARAPMRIEMRKQFAGIKADPENDRDEVAWSAETLCAAGLVRIHPDESRLWRRLRENTGWSVTVSPSSIRAFFFSNTQKL